MAQDTELAGHVLGGKYRLVREIAVKTTKVSEARHERLAGRFAIKQWPATTPWDAFRRGAEAAVTLRHPGIMQVIDFNCEPGASPFLVLEWVEGTRLTELIAESGILPIERVAPLIESAAWALAAAHQQGIVHKDLRPGEIFVVHAAGTMREWVKVAGFGVGAALARAGQAGPSRYRAPEQIDVAVDDDDDPQSDQYALAAIAYEMLAGVPPFDEQRSQSEPLPISDLAPGVSPAVDAAIRQALAPEPEQRFASVLDFARTLRVAVEGASPEIVSRRRDDSRARARSDRRGGEPISPFFNPLQGATEAFRRVATGTAKLRTLAGSRLRWPAPVSRRVAFAGGVLLLAFAGAAILARRAPMGKGTPAPTVTEAPPPAPAEAAPAPAVEEPAGAPAEAVAESPAAAAPADAGVAPADETEVVPEKDTRAVAWARLAAGSKAPKARARATQVVKVAAAPRPAAKPVAVPKKMPPAAAAAAGAGPCVMSVGSKPPADVWIDEKNLGRRTPVAAYHLACGPHKLVLKRADLDIYQMEMITLKPGAHFKKVYPLQ